jgi:hypothetical protein
VTYPAAPRRSRVGGLLALLLALLFLAVLGASVGFVAGLQVNKHRAAVEEQSQTGGGDGTQSTGNPPPTGSTPTGKRCHEVTERDAKVGALIEVRYIKTNRSEAWICRDPGGGLWYQGHLLSGPLDSNDFSLLLSEVSKDGDTYVATNPKDGTRYLVYADKLVIEQNGTRREPEMAVESTG